MEPNSPSLHKQQQASLWGIVRNTLSVLLGVAILGLVWLKWDDVRTALAQVRWQWIGVGLMFYFFNYLFRSLRFHTLSGKRVKTIPHAFHAACLHGMASYLLPLRIGDLALPVILKSVSNIGLTEGGRILIKARLYDIITLGIWITIAAALSGTRVSPSLRLTWLAMGAAMAICPFAAYYLGKRMNLPDHGPLRYLAMIRDMARPRLSLLWQSGVVWTAVASSHYCAAVAVGLSLNWGDIFLLISIQLPLMLIPVQGVAQSGTHEGGWVAALVLIGIPADDGLNFALASHAVFLIYVLTLGLAALVVRPSSRPER